MIGEGPDRPELWFNFGHGHQGFTPGPASGRLIAEMMSLRPSVFVDPAPFRPALPPSRRA